MKKRFAASAMILAMSAATVLSPLTTFAEAEEQELNIAIFQGGYGDAYWNQMVELFEASHEGVKVNMTISPTIGDIIRPQIVAGNAPDFICLNDGAEDGVILSLIKEHALLNLDDVFDGENYAGTGTLRDDITDGILSSTKCAPYGDDEIYLAPFNSGPQGLIYNKTFFDENNLEVPKTWEELVDQAAADGGVQFDATSIYYDFGFVRACGGYIFKYQDGAYDTADIGLDNEGSVDAYAFINDLCNKYKLITADVTADIARSNFQNGKCAYYIGGPWDIDGFTSAETPFGITEMPTFHGQAFVTPVGTQVSFVGKDSDKQEPAWSFIKYLIENGAKDLYEAGDRIPARLSDQELEEIRENAYAKAFIVQINQGEPMPTVSEMGQLWSIHVNNIRSMWSGEQTPEEAAKNMVAQLEEAVELMNSGK